MMGEGESGQQWWQKTYGYARSKLQSEELDFELDMQRRKEESPAHKDFYDAVLASRKSANVDGIRAVLDDDGVLRLSARQGIAAACSGREDIGTVMRLQLALLQRLDRLHLLERTTLECLPVLLQIGTRNRTLLWVIIWLLAYIAYRVS